MGVSLAKVMVMWTIFWYFVCIHVASSYGCKSCKGYGHVDHVFNKSKYRIISQSQVTTLLIFNLIVSWKDILSKYRIINQSKVSHSHRSIH